MTNKHSKKEKNYSRVLTRSNQSVRKFPIYSPKYVSRFDIICIYVPYRKADDASTKYIEYQDVNRIDKTQSRFGKIRPMVVVGKDVFSDRIILAPCSSSKKENVRHNYRYNVRYCSAANLQRPSEIFVDNFIAVKPHELRENGILLGRLACHDATNYLKFMYNYYSNPRNIHRQRIIDGVELGYATTTFRLG